eukprot:IDg4829t1
MQASESLLLVYAICFLIATSHLLIKSTLLPFLNELSYSTGTNASFYFYSTAMHPLLRSPLTALAGELSVHFGTVKTMRFTISASLVGLLLMLTSRLSKAMFLIGYLLTASLITTRVLRVLMLSDLVSSHDRTTALNAHESVQLSSLFSAPLVWLGAQSGARLQSGDGGHDTSEPYVRTTGARLWVSATARERSMVRGGTGVCTRGVLVLPGADRSLSRSEGSFRRKFSAYPGQHLRSIGRAAGSPLSGRGIVCAHRNLDVHSGVAPNVESTHAGDRAGSQSARRRAVPAAWRARKRSASGRRLRSNVPCRGVPVCGAERTVQREREPSSQAPGDSENECDGQPGGRRDEIAAGKMDGSTVWWVDVLGDPNPVRDCSAADVCAME